MDNLRDFDITSSTRKRTLEHLGSMRVGKGTDVYDYIGVFEIHNKSRKHKVIIQYNKNKLPSANDMLKSATFTGIDYSYLKVDGVTELEDAFMTIWETCSNWKEDEYHYLVPFSYLIGSCKGQGVDLYKLGIVN
jgi:hypothetical protein